jgi:hypothetical protein
VTGSTDLLDLIAGQVADVETAWSIGTFGAIAEFTRDAEETAAFDRGTLSGLKWSSQHPDEGGCDEDSTAAFGSVWAGAIVVARSTLRGRTR